MDGPLREAAVADGILLGAASGFRDFDAALIWNEKARGERELLDFAEQPLDVGALSEDDRLFALLRWSALPGASRHHWGTDVDVFDRAAFAPGTSPLLRRREMEPGGGQARLGQWLVQSAGRFGFFHPYHRDRGGVAPEPWHLSYARLVVSLLEAHSLALLTTTLERAELELKQVALRHLDDIYRRFVQNIAPAPFAQPASAAPIIRQAEAADTAALEGLYRVLVPGNPRVHVNPDRLTLLRRDPCSFVFVIEQDGAVRGRWR